MPRREPDEPMAAPKGESLKPSEPKAAEPRGVTDGSARGLVPSAPEPPPRVARQQVVEPAPRENRVIGGPPVRQAEAPPVGDAQNVAECLAALGRITDAGSLAQIAATAKSRWDAAEATEKVKAEEAAKAKAEAEKAAAKAQQAE